jgi:ribosomal protein S18 acetylase RimI-like enzyme
MPTDEPAAAPVEIRAVLDEPELRQAFARIAPLFTASVDPKQDFRLGRLLEHFSTDRQLMLVALDADGHICGAALGYRESDSAVKLQALAAAPQLRRQGVGTRLVTELERRAQQDGCTSIYLGAEESARPFYAALDYRGRLSMLSKSLAGAAAAMSPAARHQRLTALRAARTRRSLG